MASKTILLLALLSMVLLIASQVSSRELSETSNAEETNGVYGGGAYYKGGGHKGGGGHKCYCCGKYHCKCCKDGVGQKPDADIEGKPQN